MKTEKIDPDPFPPPCWKAPVTGVDELLALGGLNTQKSVRPVYIQAFLNRSTSPGFEKYSAIRRDGAAKRRNVIMWIYYSILLKSKENDRIRE